MLPSDIGHAAAYEAYRTWLHNRSIYEPLSGDEHRQREGLIGLAIAEGRLIDSTIFVHLIGLQPLVYFPMQDVKVTTIPAVSRLRLQLPLLRLCSSVYVVLPQAFYQHTKIL
jgi:hypothetical protein